MQVRWLKMQMRGVVGNSLVASGKLEEHFIICMIRSKFSRSKSVCQRREPLHNKYTTRNQSTCTHLNRYYRGPYKIVDSSTRSCIHLHFQLANSLALCRLVIWFNSVAVAMANDNISWRDIAAWLVAQLPALRLLSQRTPQIYFNLINPRQTIMVIRA